MQSLSIGLGHLQTIELLLFYANLVNDFSMPVSLNAFHLAQNMVRKF